MPNTFDDKIRGMLLLGAYGDALGAAQEGQETPTPDPLPTRLVARDMPEWGEAWGTWLPAIVHAKRIGMPTDDTCYRLCVLHPWLAAIADDDRTFDEASLRDFMAALRHEPLYPEWYSFACRDHLTAWLDMFQAHQENRSEGLFSPGVPGVFGLFLYLEMAAVRHGTTPLETFTVYQRQASLDQGYAKAVTGFVATLVSLAVNEAAETSSFGDWFFDRGRAVLDDLAAATQTQEAASLRGVLEAMAQLGRELRGETESTLNTVFKQRVLDPPMPPFLDHAFLGGLHDPYRVLAQLTATIAYAPDDPATALRAIAHSCGNTATLASLLGSLLGAWYGAEQLSTLHTEGLDFQAELDIVETNLTELFHFDLGQHGLHSS
ncbi:MAG: ADP-ribosylglycohydrolase family protein [Desulfurellaceae bacterium]|nr:ADP-ribosylglycohydrolase family protein [Desulfurellaceae bacterium]